MEAGKPGIDVSAEEMNRRRTRQALERFATKKLIEKGWVTIEDTRTSLEIGLLENVIDIDDNLVSASN